MAVVLYIGTQLGPELGLKSLCRIDRNKYSNGCYGPWIIRLYEHPKIWAKKHRMSYQLSIYSQWEVAMTVEDPRLATLFKLTWL